MISNVDNLAAHRTGGSVVAVRRMPARRLRRRHHHVARFRQRRVDDRIADHRGAHPVVGVIAAPVLLHQLDAERLDLVDVLGAGEPAVDGSDVAFGRARADLGAEEGADAGTRWGFRGQKIDAGLAAPVGVPLHGGLDQITHGLGVGCGVEKLARGGEGAGVMCLDAVGQACRAVGHFGLLEMGCQEQRLVSADISSA